ncbi:MAG TPA: SRPBCC family protein [Roseiarcus sp.]|nr:SRPBCC family protein [Roseiarcus sp.]
MIRNYVSSVIDAPIEKVWALLRDFNSLPQWHPRMVESEIEGGLPSDKVGCVRRLKLASGPVLRERLLGLSDRDHTVIYTIEKTPQPITNHVATVKLTAVTDGDRTFAEWSAEFDAPPDEEQALAKGMAENVFLKGLNALAAHLAKHS